jgi:hypothetical protein
MHIRTYSTHSRFVSGPQRRHVRVLLTLLNLDACKVLAESCSKVAVNHHSILLHPHSAYGMPSPGRPFFFRHLLSLCLEFS